MVRVTILPADLSSREGCRALYRAAQGENIDILVNNAGLGLFGPFDETDLEAELGMLDVNIIAMHMLMKLFLPDLEAKDRGYILNVASSAAFLPGPLLSSYYASKAYVLRLSEAVAEELRRAGSGVRISVLCPGPVQTEFDQVANVCFSAPSLSSQAGGGVRGERHVSGEAGHCARGPDESGPSGPASGAGPPPGTDLLARPAEEKRHMRAPRMQACTAGCCRPTGKNKPGAPSDLAPGAGLFLHQFFQKRLELHAVQHGGPCRKSAGDALLDKIHCPGSGVGQRLAPEGGAQQH